MTNPPVSYDLDCARASLLIDAFLLDELESPDAARLAAHIKGCAVCTAEVGSSTLVIALVGSLPLPQPTTSLDERILLAALDDRARRHAHRSWLSDLRTQVLRGAMRTTGTLVATIIAVSLLGAAFVFAASQLVAQLPVFNGSATIPTVMPTQFVAPTASPRPASPTPGAVVATPVPVVVATPAPAVDATPEPTPEPTLEPSADATLGPVGSPVPTPDPSPTSSPTEKPRRTPPPSASPSPSDTAAPDAATPLPLP